MLESKEMLEKEKRSYLDYDRDLIFKYKIRIIVENYAIKEYKKQLRSGQTKNVALVKYAETSSDKRGELFEFIKKYPNYTEKQLAKLLFRESEFYPE